MCFYVKTIRLDSTRLDSPEGHPLRLPDEFQVFLVGDFHPVILSGLSEAFPLVVATALIPPPLPSVRPVVLVLVVLVSDHETVEAVLVVLVLPPCCAVPTSTSTSTLTSKFTPFHAM